MRVQNSRTEHLTAWANVVIAFSSVVAFTYAIYQNHQSQELLTQAQYAFTGEAFPLVKFDKITWHGGPDPSCSNPPTVLWIGYMNKSDVPVTITHSTVELFVGDRPFAPGPPEISNDPGPALLAGRDGSGMQFSGQEVAEFYKRMIPGGPSLKLAVTLEYESLISHRAYKYHARVEIRSSCEHPQNAAYMVGPEIVEELGTNPIKSQAH